MNRSRYLVINMKRKIIDPALASALLAFGLCAASAALALMPAAGQSVQQPSASASSRAGAEQDRYQLAAEYSKTINGRSVLVLKGGQIVFEQYHNGHSADTPHRLASGTKSFAGAMAVAAIADGLLKLDEPVAETITEWRSDARKAKITIRQLLSLTSGLEPGTNGRPPSYARAIEAAALHDPGSRFAYGPAPFQIFGEVMRRKLAASGRKEDPLQYLERRIFNPIGLKYARWTRAADGNPQLPAGAFLTAREWAKFGLLVMNKGKWEGRQIIPAKLLAECFNGSQANPAYGLTFWLNRPGLGAQASEPGETAQNNRRRQSGAGIYLGGLRDLVMAAGAGKQRLYIIPSRDLVIVRQGEGGPFDDAQFLARLLDGREPAEQ